MTLHARSAVGLRCKSHSAAMMTRIFPNPHQTRHNAVEVLQVSESAGGSDNQLVRVRVCGKYGKHLAALGDRANNVPTCDTNSV